jgi:hypothetical protein
MKRRITKRIRKIVDAYQDYFGMDIMYLDEYRSGQISLEEFVNDNIGWIEDFFNDGIRAIEAATRDE